MSAGTEAAATPTWMVWTGRIVSVLPVLGLVMSGAMKVMKRPEVMEGFPKLGYDVNIAVPLGIVELACTVLYAIPQTSVLGAVLLTGYLGGATATHVRLGESFLAPVIMGVLVGLGLFLRDARIRALLPWRK